MDWGKKYAEYRLIVKSKVVWPIESRIKCAKLRILTLEARRIGAYLAYTQDPQGTGFYVLTLSDPHNKKEVLAAHLYPGIGMDVYFPAPLIPEVMYAKAFSEDRPFNGSLKEGIERLHAAHRRLLSFIEFEKAKGDIRSSI